MDAKIALISSILCAYLIETYACVCPTHLADAQHAGRDLYDFKADLYKKLIADERYKNVIVSPLSISQTLALLESGAKEKTQYDLSKQLSCHPTNSDRVALNHQSLQHRLNQPVHDVSFSLANGIFLSPVNSLVQHYRDEVAPCFNADVRNLDFKQNTDQSRQEINAYISSKTHGKIPELFKQGMLNPDSSAVLVNTAYLQTPWLASAVVEGDFPFVPSHGGLQGAKYFSIDDDDVRSKQFSFGTVVKLPLLGNFSFFVVLPNRYSFKKIANWTNGDNLYDLLDFDEQRYRLDYPKVFMPMFVVNSSFHLTDILNDIGLKCLFDGTGDFSRMISDSLTVSSVEHNAYIKVNENGVEAAAVTGAQIAWYMGADKTNIWINKTFDYYVKHDTTNAIVFMGRVNLLEYF